MRHRCYTFSKLIVFYLHAVYTQAMDEGWAFCIDIGENCQQTLESFVSSEKFSLGDANFIGYNTEIVTSMAVLDIE